MSFLVRRPWTEQPQYRPEVNQDVWPGRSQIVLPSLGYAGVIGGVETLSGTDANAQFSKLHRPGRVMGWRPNSSTNPGEFYLWSCGNFDVGPNASMLAILSSPNWGAGIESRLEYGGLDWGLALRMFSTQVNGRYVDNPTSASYTATLSGLPALANDEYRAVGLTKIGNIIKVFTGGQVASSFGANGGIRRSAGSSLGEQRLDVGSLSESTLMAITSQPLPDSVMLELTAHVDAPWQIFRRRIFVPVSAPSGIPVLSGATVFDITSTSARPRVTITF